MNFWRIFGCETRIDPPFLVRCFGAQLWSALHSHSGSSQRGDSRHASSGHNPTVKNRERKGAARILIHYQSVPNSCYCSWPDCNRPGAAFGRTRNNDPRSGRSGPTEIQQIR